MDLLLLIILILAFCGSGPWWGYSHNWGWGPDGLIGLILIIVLIRAALGRNTEL